MAHCEFDRNASDTGILVPGNSQSMLRLDLVAITSDETESPS